MASKSWAAATIWSRVTSIGTDVSGTKDLGNAHDGVVIDDTTDTGVVVRHDR